MNSLFEQPHPSSIKSSKLKPFEPSCGEAHAANWLAYHLANPEVYAEFCKFAEKMRIKTRRHSYSVETVINVLRWHRDLETTDEDFKINNNFKSFYARMYMWHYDCPHFFKCRKSFADDLIFPASHKGILVGRLPLAE